MGLISLKRFVKRQIRRIKIKLKTVLKGNQAVYKFYDTVKNNNLRVSQLMQTRDALVNRNNTLISSNQNLRETIRNFQPYREAFRDMAPIYRCLKFARLCLESKSALRADIYICHDVLPLVSGVRLSRELGGKLFCNVIEIPSFYSRAIKVPWKAEVLGLIESSIMGNLQTCDHFITVGPTLGEKINNIGPPVTVIENFRYRENLVSSNEIRKRCRLHNGDLLILSISVVASGFEDVLFALAKFPQNVHLACIGKFAPKSYEDTINKLVKNLKIEKRVHFFDFVPYQELTSIASGADVGLIVRDPKIINNYVSLPNRVFDYIASGLPFCAPDIPDIAKIMREYEVGVVVENINPDGWFKAIDTALVNRKTLKENTINSMSGFTWEQKEDQIFQLVGDARKVTFLGMGDLTNNNRTKRMARSLAQKGIHCVICCVSQNDSKPEHKNINYHIFSNLSPE